LQAIQDTEVTPQVSSETLKDNDEGNDNNDDIPTSPINQEAHQSQPTPQYVLRIDLKGYEKQLKDGDTHSIRWKTHAGKHLLVKRDTIHLGQQGSLELVSDASVDELKSTLKMTYMFTNSEESVTVKFHS